MPAMNPTTADGGQLPSPLFSYPQVPHPHGERRRAVAMWTLPTGWLSLIYRAYRIAAVTITALVGEHHAGGGGMRLLLPATLTHPPTPGLEHEVHRRAEGVGGGAAARRDAMAVAFSRPDL